jgi:pimeloyl-ACP methyl ester carboxylesterase
MSDFVLPTTRYAVSGEVNIAYQTMGDGPIDIVLVPGIISHVEFLHEFSEYTAFLRRLSKFARVVTFDKRGQGLSDKISGAPSLEERMDDLRAIMDAIGSQRAALLGVSEGSAMSALFAATYPERVSQLILYGGFARNADLSGSDSLTKKVLPGVGHWATAT